MAEKIISYLKENNGLSLIEVLAAVVLLGVAIVPLAGILSDQAIININSGKRYAAMQLASEKVEEIVGFTRGKTKNGDTGNKLRNGKKDNWELYPYENPETDYVLGFERTVSREKVDEQEIEKGNSGTGSGSGPKYVDYLFKYTVKVSWGSESVTMYVFHTEV